MIDGSARKVGQLRARIGNRGFSILIWIADDGVSVRHIEIMADQCDAKGRVKVVQKPGSHLGNPVAFVSRSSVMRLASFAFARRTIAPSQ